MRLLKCSKSNINNKQSRAKMPYPLPHIHCQSKPPVLINSHVELIATIQDARLDELPALAGTIRGATFSGGHISLVYAWELKLSKHGFPHGHGVTKHLAAQSRALREKTAPI
jgi:hypothetical protein